MKTPLYSDVVTKMQARVVKHAAREFVDELDIANGSPIETVFVATMLGHGWLSSFTMGIDTSSRCIQHLRAEGLEIVVDSSPRSRVYGDGWPYVNIAAVSQSKLVLPSGRLIRPDFAFVWINDEHVEKAVVELDGHDFHERTPEQAHSDKSRDRELQALGWKVLRFTGREVLRKPRECLHEVEKLVSSKSYAAEGYPYPELEKLQ